MKIVDDNGGKWLIMVDNGHDRTIGSSMFLYDLRMVDNGWFG